DRSERQAYLHRFRWNTCAIAAQPKSRSRDPGHGPARFARTIVRGAGTFAAALHSAQSPGQFLRAVEQRIPIWPAHRFPPGATRLRSRESRSLDLDGLFSAMDAADAVKSQIQAAIRSSKSQVRVKPQVPKMKDDAKPRKCAKSQRH